MLTENEKSVITDMTTLQKLDFLIATRKALEKQEAKCKKLFDDEGVKFYQDLISDSQATESALIQEAASK